MAFNRYNFILIIITAIIIILLLNLNKKIEKVEKVEIEKNESFINPFSNIFTKKNNNNSETFQDNNEKCDCPIRPIEAKKKIGKVNRILEEERVLSEKQRELRKQLGELSKEIVESRVQPVPQKGVMATPLVDSEKANIEITKELEAQKALSDKMININYYCNGNKSSSLETSSTSNILSSNTDIDCLNLNQTGFNKNWNYNNVKRLYKTSSGKSLMKRIDNNFKTLSNKTLTNEIITKCYPNYYNSNLSSNNSNQEEIYNSKKYLNQEEEISNQEENNLNKGEFSEEYDDNIEETLSPIILMTDDDQDSRDVNFNLINISPDSNDDEYDELSEMISENFQNKNSKNIKKKVLNNFTPKLTKCDLSSLRIEIRSSIARHYTNKVNMMEKENLFPVGLNKQKVYADYQKNFDYMIDRAMLEIQNLIMNYKDKKFSIYQNEINRLKIRSPSGLSLMGTDYYIPWTLINKYEVCFAKVENKKTYPVQYKS